MDRQKLLMLLTLLSGMGAGATANTIYTRNKNKKEREEFLRGLTKTAGLKDVWKYAKWPVLAGAGVGAGWAGMNAYHKHQNKVRAEERAKILKALQSGYRLGYLRARLESRQYQTA